MMHFSALGEPKTSKSKKKRKKRRGKKGRHDDSSDEDDHVSHPVVDIGLGEMPDGAVSSDPDEQDKQGIQGDDALNQNLDM